MKYLVYVIPTDFPVLLAYICRFFFLPQKIIASYIIYHLSDQDKVNNVHSGLSFLTEKMHLSFLKSNRYFLVQKWTSCSIYYCLLLCNSGDFKSSIIVNLFKAKKAFSSHSNPNNLLQQTFLFVTLRYL